MQGLFLPFDLLLHEVFPWTVAIVGLECVPAIRLVCHRGEEEKKKKKQKLFLDCVRPSS